MLTVRTVRMQAPKIFCFAFATLPVVCRHLWFWWLLWWVVSSWHVDFAEASAAVLSPAQQHKSTAEVHVLSMTYMVSSSLPQLSPITNVVEGLVIVTAPDVILDSESTPNMYGSEPA